MNLLSSNFLIDQMQAKQVISASGTHDDIAFPKHEDNELDPPEQLKSARSAVPIEALTSSQHQ